jgi:hypothetical protein
MKTMVLTRFNVLFHKHAVFSFRSLSKSKVIEVSGVMKPINPLYMTFNGHIELQVVTDEEHAILTETHDKYLEDKYRKNETKVYIM